MYTKMDALGFVWSATWFSLSFGHIFENVHDGTIPKPPTPLPTNLESLGDDDIVDHSGLTRRCAS